MTLDITPATQEAVPLLALLAPSWRGLLAAVVCACWALAVGMGLALVDWVERRGRRG